MAEPIRPPVLKEDIVSKVKNTLISVIAIGLLAGSSVGVAAQDEAVPATASAGCDEPLVEPGEYEDTNDFEEAGQGYWVVVPADYAELAPAPLILWLAAGGRFAGREYAVVASVSRSGRKRLRGG
jgi:hypothetical protein